MVWATCTERTQLLRPLRSSEGQSIFVVSIVGDNAAVRGRRSSKCRQNLGCYVLAILNRDVLDSAEQRALLRLMFKNELAHVVNGVNAVQIALALRLSPGKQAMAAKNQAFRSGIVPDCFFKHKRQFKSGTLPGKPYDFAVKFLVERFQLSLSIGARRQGDGPVRVQMVHMVKGKKSMQRSIDGCCHAILAKG